MEAMRIAAKELRVGTGGRDIKQFSLHKMLPMTKGRSRRYLIYGNDNSSRVFAPEAEISDVDLTKIPAKFYRRCSSSAIIVDWDAEWAELKK